MNEQFKSKCNERGFSLLELIIAMSITITIAGLACTLLAQSLNMRKRSNDRIDALADAQRALNVMSREIASAGFNLSDNGIVAEDSITDANGNSTIRLRANLNKFTSSISAARTGIGTVGEDAGEDVKYFLYPTANTNLLARYDAYSIAGGSSTVLANRLDSLRIHYFAQRVTYNTSGCDITGASASEVAVSAAKFIVIAVCVNERAVGAPGTPGYQPGGNILLVSDVALRNANLSKY
jgi:prepilin-type N-terminal cleavage/methylation domain-containing protein